MSPLLPPRVTIWRFFAQCCELRETSLWPWLFPVTINVPCSSVRLSSNTSSVVICPPDNVNVFEWYREWPFFWHVEINSRLNVMTINMVPRNPPEIVSGFCVIRLVWCLRPVPTLLGQHRCAPLLVPHAPELKWIFGIPDPFEQNISCLSLDWSFAEIGRYSPIDPK